MHWQDKQQMLNMVIGMQVMKKENIQLVKSGQPLLVVWWLRN